MHFPARIDVLSALRLACLSGVVALSAGCAVSEVTQNDDNPFVVDEDDNPITGLDGSVSVTDDDDEDESSGGDGDGDGDGNGDGEGERDGGGITIPDAGGDGDGDGDGDMSEPDAGPMCVPANCNDNVACTNDSCGSNGQCSNVPDDSKCSGGDVCTPTGCEASNVCAESPCKLVSPQCGCAAGQGCYLGAGNQPTCAPAGTRNEGANCSGNSDCKPGATCITIGSTSSCTTMCDADAQCDAALDGSQCAIDITNALGQPIGITICSTPCNLMTQSGCAAGSFCALDRQEDPARYATDCFPSSVAGTGTQGQDCEVDGCAPGFACLGSVLLGYSCHEYCRTDSDCPGLLFCDGNFNPPLTVNGTTYRFCRE